MIEEYQTKTSFIRITGSKIDSREKVSITPKDRKIMTIRQGIRFLFNGNKIKFK